MGDCTKGAVVEGVAAETAGEELRRHWLALLAAVWGASVALVIGVVDLMVPLVARGAKCVASLIATIARRILESEFLCGFRGIHVRLVRLVRLNRPAGVRRAGRVVPIIPLRLKTATAKPKLTAGARRAGDLPLRQPAGK